MKEKNAYVYILASQRNGTLYVWVTSDLIKRMYEHQNWIFEGFTKKYNCKILVHFEILWNMYDAISREKFLKWKKRGFKIDLIEKENKLWKNLGEVL